jgi:hypothetical protein
MPRHRSYLNHIHSGVTHLIERTDKFTNDPIPSAGIDFINSLIVRADIPYLLKFTNDVDRFYKIYKEYRSPLYSDFLRQYPVREKNFIFSRKGKSVEYLLISDDIDIIENIPFGSNNLNDWLRVRPLRMLSNDSPEIQLDIITSKLRYREKPPMEVVFSINIIKLLMVYTKYRLMYPEQFVENINNYPFIYKACLLPLLYDNIKNWMMKIIYDITILKAIDSKATYDTDGLIHGEKSVFIPGGRQAALLEVEDMITKCADGKVKPDEVINSLYISENKNILQELRWLTDSHYIGHSGAQYRWLEFVREYFSLATMVAIYGLQPNSNRSYELKVLFDVVAKRLANTRFWSNAGNPFLVKHIENKFEMICSLI